MFYCRHLLLLSIVSALFAQGKARPECLHDTQVISNDQDFKKEYNNVKEKWYQCKNTESCATAKDLNGTTVVMYFWEDLELEKSCDKLGGTLNPISFSLGETGQTKNPFYIGYAQDLLCMAHSCSKKDVVTQISTTETSTPSYIETYVPTNLTLKCEHMKDCNIAFYLGKQVLFDYFPHNKTVIVAEENQESTLPDNPDVNFPPSEDDMDLDDQNPASISSTAAIILALVLAIGISSSVILFIICRTIRQDRLVGGLQAMMTAKTPLEVGSESSPKGSRFRFGYF